MGVVSVHELRGTLFIMIGSSLWRMCQKSYSVCDANRQNRFVPAYEYLQASLCPSVGFRLHFPLCRLVIIFLYRPSSAVRLTKMVRRGDCTQNEAPKRLTRGTLHRTSSRIIPSLCIHCSRDQTRERQLWGPSWCHLRRQRWCPGSGLGFGPPTAETPFRQSAHYLSHECHVISSTSCQILFILNRISMNTRHKESASGKTFLEVHGDWFQILLGARPSLRFPLSCRASWIFFPKSRETSKWLRVSSGLDRAAGPHLNGSPHWWGLLWVRLWLGFRGSAAWTAVRSLSPCHLCFCPAAQTLSSGLQQNYKNAVNSKSRRIASVGR